MDIGYLREFVVLVRCESYTKASVMLNVSQPTLSKHMMALEREFGCELLVRGQTATKPTPIGRVFLQSARRLLGEYDDMRDQVRRLREMTPRDIRVMLWPEDKLSRDLLAAARKALSSELPLVNVVEVQPDPDVPPCESVRGGDVDLFIGITLPDAADADLAFTPLFSDPETLVVHASHRLAGSTCVSVCELDGEKIFMPARHSVDEMRSIAARMLEAHGVEPRFVDVDLDEGEVFLARDFTEGAMLVPISMAFYSIPAQGLRDHALVRLEEPDTAVWRYVACGRQADSERDYLVAELQRQAQETNASDLWLRLASLTER